MVSGSKVDLPAPGGAVTTSEPLWVRASFTAVAICDAGSELYCSVMSLTFIYYEMYILLRVLRFQSY